MTDQSAEKLSAYLGFAMKAGKVRSGEFAAERSLKSGMARAAVLDESASENAVKHWTNICESAGVPLIRAAGVGRSIGRDTHMIACIEDEGFAKAVLRSRNDIEQ